MKKKSWEKRIKARKTLKKNRNAQKSLVKGLAHEKGRNDNLSIIYIWKFRSIVGRDL